MQAETCSNILWLSRMCGRYPYKKLLKFQSRFAAVTINPLMTPHQPPQPVMGPYGVPEPQLNMKVTSFAEMSTEQFARRVTGSDNLSQEEMKQIREQQQVSQCVQF